MGYTTPTNHNRRTYFYGVKGGDRMLVNSGDAKDGGWKNDTKVADVSGDAGCTILIRVGTVKQIDNSGVNVANSSSEPAYYNGIELGWPVRR